MLRDLIQRVRAFFLPSKALLQKPGERRRLVRVRCRIPVQIRPAEQTLSGWIVDMGVQGLRLRTGEALKTGTVVSVRATMAQQSAQSWVNCRIMWSRLAEGGKHHIAGASFDETRDNLRKTWVHRLLRELGLNENSLRERREFLRVNGSVPVRLRSLKEPEKGAIPIESLNLGVAGLLVKTLRPLDPGDRYECWIGPWGKLPEVGPIPGEVLSSRPDPSGRGSLAPLRFLELDEDSVRELGRYVLTLLREV